MKLRNVFLSGVFALAMPMVAVAEAANLDQLLNLVKEGQARRTIRKEILLLIRN